MPSRKGPKSPPQRYTQGEELPPPIYSVPTTDTLGDESQYKSRPYPFFHAPSRTHPFLSDGGSGSGAYNNTHQKAAQTASARTKSSSAHRRRRATSKPSGKKKTSVNEFQNPEDFMKVTVQAVHVAQRSAFDVRPPMSLQEWKDAAEKAERVKGKSITKRLSPSYQHLQVLHQLHRTTVVRQVQFSPSVSLDSDPFVPWDGGSSDVDDDETKNNNNSSKNSKKDDNTSSKNSSNARRRSSKKQHHRRDGRYRSIHPVQATVAALPSVAPVLSHKKTRLPMRADVGFGNAPPAEIQLKQDEIRHETAWEEASPRLVVLVMSDDLGTAVVEQAGPAAVIRDEQTKKKMLHPAHLAWNGGGLEGMPYAGRELLQAKERNAKHFGKPPLESQVAKFLQPNPYSMLAPPLEASYSPSQGWRPRPFHDRPAGRAYFLACPMQVQLENHNLKKEALVASLALYTLPTAGTAASSGSTGRLVCGKISEEFWFPLGDWAGKVNSDATRRTGDGSVDPELVELWLNRKQKAIFSYDPLATSKDSLFVVLRAYEIVHPSFLSGEISDPPALLHPICYGLTQAYPVDLASQKDVQWPHGESRNVKLYSCEGVLDSQETFVDRLVGMLRGSKREPSFDENDICDSSDISNSPTPSEGSKKRRGVGRIFRSSIKGSKARSPIQPAPVPSTGREHAPVIVGKANMFLSSLTVDFLQCLLSSPVELLRGQSGSKRRLPHLLVDVSGDFAVALEEHRAEQALPDATEPVKKRSNLLRLAAAANPAGYAGSCEFREVLHLPARPEKHYFFDTALSSRSSPNILFLFPRLLRYPPRNNGGKAAKYTIRLRAIRSEAVLDESNGKTSTATTATTSFHNPLCWSSGNLVNEVFTSVLGPLNESGEEDAKGNLPMNDEFKLRLPLLLDGSFSLELCLFEANRSGETVELQRVTETSIPLSSSAPREGSAGGRVATAIPNGNHRLKLGEFQLQLETRLVSSIHVGDPSVALVLRDFPYARQIDYSGEQEQVSANGGPKRVQSFESSGSPVPRVLGSASESATVSQFYALMHVHLGNFVKSKESSGNSNLRDNIRSMFDVLNKAKCRLQSGAFSEPPGEELQAFIKESLDHVDEGSFTNEGTSNLSASSIDASVDNVSTDNHIDTSQDDVDAHGASDEHDGGAILRTKSSKLSQSESRISRKASTVGKYGAPFSRVAYGASKTDRMRLEAELRVDSAHSGPFFDDDETVATAYTMHSDGRRHVPVSDNSIVLDLPAENTFLGPASTATTTTRIPVKESPPRDGNAEFANRVRTVAQVMLAPCVGPTLSNILAGKSSPNKKEADDEKSRPTSPFEPFLFVYSPGSDGEDSIEAREQSPSQEENVFRGSRGSSPFRFSLQMEKPNEIPTGSGEYIYESIIVLWLRAWLDHVETTLAQSELRGAAGRVATFPIPPFNPQITSDRDVFSFYAHMDYLLPLCLKSMVLRHSVEIASKFPPSTKAILDDSHMVILEAFVELLARGLVGQALSGLGSADTRAGALSRALSSSEIVLDFLVGLLSVLHPQHLNVLVTKYFHTLRDCETEHLDDLDGVDFKWSEESLHRVRCSRQLRIRAIEVLSCLPSFLALNYPLKFSTERGPKSFSTAASWVNQYQEIELGQGASQEPLLYEDGDDRLPKSGWLAELVVGEGLSVCSLSCEAVVAEAMAHMEVSRQNRAGTKSPALKKRPGAALRRDDLLMFQSISIHAVTCIYELVLRRHAMDRRFQKESARGRIAALFARPILEKSIESVRWLARMESTHKVRSIWLLTFVYVLQEAPDVLMREYVRSCCNPEDMRIHRYIRLLRLCSSTFQSFVDLPKYSAFPSEIGKGIAPWLLQESFNTICASTNVVVEECVSLASSYPREQEKIMHGILDLLLHVLTTPQSSVTHLRAVGGALQVLEQFGVAFFLEAAGENLQHWLRVILSLMNSVALSVRSIAVDFVLSLVGNAFDLEGNIDDLSVIFVSVLPEVAAREIGLCSVNGLISSMDDVAKTLWPLRRSIADLEDANPLDDDRIDPQLPQILSVFCRACQAVLDGVLIELRLKGENVVIVGTQIPLGSAVQSGFDADEESLFEAADFFVPEVGPLQRIRWLSTLAALHEAKGQWIEAAETLFLSARAMTESIPHLRNMWRPSKFPLWSDTRRSLWLETVGEDIGCPDRGNAQVMEFAGDFLEPSSVVEPSFSSSGHLLQPSLAFICSKLADTAKNAVNFYLKEEGLDELAYSRLESLQKSLVSVLEDHALIGSARGLAAAARKRHVSDEAELRKVLTAISGGMTQLAERLLLIVQNEPSTPARAAREEASHRPSFVLVRLCGKKPMRFQESTTLPTFVEWDTPCVCRVPRSMVKKPDPDPKEFSRQLCRAFADPFLVAFKAERGAEAVIFRSTSEESEDPIDRNKTYVQVLPVDAVDKEPTAISTSPLDSKRFLHRTSKAFVEMTVAHTFPCALSRQRVLLQSEIVSASTNNGHFFPS